MSKLEHRGNISINDMYDDIPSMPGVHWNATKLNGGHGYGIYWYDPKQYKDKSIEDLLKDAKRDAEQQMGGKLKSFKVGHPDSSAAGFGLSGTGYNIDDLIKKENEIKQKVRDKKDIPSGKDDARELIESYGFDYRSVPQK